MSAHCCNVNKGTLECPYQVRQQLTPTRHQFYWYNQQLVLQEPVNKGMTGWFLTFLIIVQESVIKQVKIWLKASSLWIQCSLSLFSKTYHLSLWSDLRTEEAPAAEDRGGRGGDRCGWEMHHLLVHVGGWRRRQVSNPSQNHKPGLFSASEAWIMSHSTDSGIFFFYYSEALGNTTEFHKDFVFAGSFKLLYFLFFYF